MKNIILSVINDALRSVSGKVLVEQACGHHPLDSKLHVVSIGKAAAAMAAGVYTSCPNSVDKCLVITGSHYLQPWVNELSQAEIIEAGHPVPDEKSIVAGRRLLEWLRESDEDASFLFLISGGASSFVEVLRDSIDLEFLQRTNRWLLSSGLAIEQMNQVRRSLSLIKGGGLLPNLAGRSASVWLISDVAEDDLATIGSGLLYPAHERSIINALPDWLNEVVSDASDSMVGNLVVPPHDILANIESLCERVAEEARARGIAAQIQDVQLCGDAASKGEEIADQLEHLPSGIHIWGGETTVQLPFNPGRGGRNQHLALAAAIKLNGQKNCGLLALGSDGVDGNTEDAGALVNGDTVSRGEIAGLNAIESLSRADSGTFLEASGDLVSIGPTGTNVRDIVIAWKE